MKNASLHKAKFSNMIRCIFFVLLFTPSLSIAQTRGKVEVIKDPLIDTLIARRSALKNSKTVSTSSSNGFRVQIFSGSTRKSAYDTQARFQSEFPGIRTYITYHEPYFKIHAGDFRTRLEAEKLMQQLKGAFTSLFIIEEKINPPKADTAND